MEIGKQTIAVVVVVSAMERKLGGAYRTRRVASCSNSMLRASS
jgi:hypothetical protein